MVDALGPPVLWGAEELAPATSSLPLLRWAQEPLSIPCKLGTPAYKLQVKTKDKVDVRAHVS
jgi:hypothetical protein